MGYRQEMPKQMLFLISPITVQRWATSWEAMREEALQDCRGSENQELDESLLFSFSCPDLVFELKSWINKRQKQGGKHPDGFATLQHIIQDHINDVLLKDQDIVSPRVISKMTVLRWVHKLG